MTSSTLPQGTAVNGMSAHRAARMLMGMGILAAGVLVMVNHPLLREAETALAGALADFVTPGSTYVVPGWHTFFLAAGTPAMHGLRITVECTAAFLIGPLLIVAGLVLASGRFGVRRTLAATLLAGGVLMAANQARLMLIAWATAEWGVADGYQWSHTVGGSAVVAIGAGLALTAFLLVLAAGRSRPAGGKRPRRRATHRAL
jgi:exosortase/archaeosortase family protein